MQVVIILASHIPSDLIFSRESGNPGIGGTTYTSIRLGIELSHRYPDLKINIVSPNDLNIKECLNNIDVTNCDNRDMCTYINDLPNSDVVLISQQDLIKIFKQGRELNNPNVICWIRHPLVDNAQIPISTVCAFVSVGEYQYFSQKLGSAPHWFIPNIFLGPPAGLRLGAPSIHDERVELVSLGALVPAKGFQYIATAWPKIKELNSNVRLTVIGSSSTYGDLRSSGLDSNLVPADSCFSERIITSIGRDDILKGIVSFKGNLGDEKWNIIAKSSVALLNPTGNTEAFPASPLECMSCGVPVIASNKLGMYDSMRFFPELSASSPRQIPNLLKKTLASEYLYDELSMRSLSVANYYIGQKNTILSRWRRLFDLISEETHIGSCPPEIALSTKTKCEIYWMHALQKSKALRRLDRILQRAI